MTSEVTPRRKLLSVSCWPPKLKCHKMNYNLSPEMHDVLLQAVKFAIQKKQNFSAGQDDYQVTLGDALDMLEQPWI